MMTARENMNKAARIMWSAVSSKDGSLPHILRKPSEDYSPPKNLETVFALRLCLELRWELRLFPIIRYKVGVVLCWCWRCWMEVSGQHGYPSFGLLGIIWFQVTLSSKFSHFKWLFFNSYCLSFNLEIWTESGDDVSGHPDRRCRLLTRACKKCLYFMLSLKIFKWIWTFNLLNSKLIFLAALIMIEWVRTTKRKAFRKI